MPAPVRVEMRGITKRFGETVAVRAVDFSATRGEIHGLLGENGAGKTSLMNVLSGLYRAERGHVLVDGAPVSIRSPSDALRHRIGMVHQHAELVERFTVLENVLLGREGTRLWLRTDRHRAAVAAVATRFGLDINLDAEVRGLAVGVQHKVEILKALYRGVDVLILDEPTTLLTPQEVQFLFATIRTLAADGLTVVFITHKIPEIFANCDRITVMRAGEVVGRLQRDEADEARLVELMIGERVSRASVQGGVTVDAGPVALEVRGLCVAADRGKRIVSDCTFAVRTGEVVGVAGVAGNGQRELAEAVLGVRPAIAGAIAIAGRDVTRGSIRQRLAAGLAYIPEDRIEDGLLPGMTVAENLILGLHHWAFSRLRFDRAAARRLARAAIDEYAVRTPGEDAAAATLSGGNIQKVLVARALALAKLVGGRALVAMSPTRGLDVRATEFVRGRMLDFARNGGGVLMISEDLDELLQICDRMLVMFRGAVVGAFERRAFDAYRIGALMAGTASVPTA